jgi:AcrR family transcriptional regulator
MAAANSRKRSKTSRHSRPLNREKIAVAAIEVVREEGAAAFSMRKVAGLFGVDVAALYRHFRNKDELLAEVGRLASESAGLDLPVDGPWEQRFLELCGAIRDRIVQHPELGLYGGGSPWATPFLARANGFLASLFVEVGLRGETLVFSTQTALHVVTSVAQSEALTRATAPEDNRIFARTIMDHLPENVLEVWPPPAPGTPSGIAFDDFFDFAVRAMLDAIVPEKLRDA